MNNISRRTGEILETESNGHQVTSDGRTVWVNDPDGAATARFSTFGIDIHRPIAEQKEKGECLFCTHAQTTEDDWNLFVEKMRELFNVTIGRLHMPIRFSVGAK